MGDQALSPEMIFGIVVLLLLIGMLLVAVWAMHRQIKAWDLPEEEVAFSLDELRQMRKSGLLTEEEYHKARQGVIAQSEAMMARRAAKVAEVEAGRPRAPLAKRLEGELNDVLKEAVTPPPPPMPTGSPATPDATGDDSTAEDAGLVEFELDESEGGGEAELDASGEERGKP